MNNNTPADNQAILERLVAKVRTNLKNGDEQYEGLSESDIDMLKDRYSHFDDFQTNGFVDSSTFCIDTVNLPKGWYHYMMNLSQVLRPVVVSIAAQDGAGCLSQDSVLFGPITKLAGNENYMHVAQVYRNTRNVWIKTDTGTVFPINPQQNMFDASGVNQSDTYDEYDCQQKPGSMTIRSQKDGIERYVTAVCTVSVTRRNMVGDGTECQSIDQKILALSRNQFRARQPSEPLFCRYGSQRSRLRREKCGNYR